mmetsp:Transcript_17909/g.42615  ORF Transcript_17909/g.42615 Transcript_17909/m.42615 type:complete len:202 (-) Transcript_17909:126-731(-)
METQRCSSALWSMYSPLLCATCSAASPAPSPRRMPSMLPETPERCSGTPSGIGSPCSPCSSPHCMPPCSIASAAGGSASAACCEMSPSRWSRCGGSEGGSGARKKFSSGSCWLYPASSASSTSNSLWSMTVAKLLTLPSWSRPAGWSGAWCQLRPSSAAACTTYLYVYSPGGRLSTTAQSLLRPQLCKGIRSFHSLKLPAR